MASGTTAKRSAKAPKTAARKPRRRPLTHAELLKLAARKPPPQSWYDETIDPTKPQSAARRGR